MPLDDDTPLESLTESELYDRWMAETNPVIQETIEKAISKLSTGESSPSDPFLVAGNLRASMRVGGDKNGRRVVNYTISEITPEPGIGVRRTVCSGVTRDFACVARILTVVAECHDNQLSLPIGS